MSESTPMWLQLQSRFIDENFDNVVRYLKDKSTLQDAFYQETLRLLQQRVEEAVQEILAIPVHKYEAPASDDEKAAHHFRFRLFVTFLCSNSKHPLYRTVMAAMLYELSVLVPGQTEQLCRLMMDVLTMEDATSLPVRWEHVNGDLLKTAMHFTAAARPKKPFTAMVDTPVGAVCFHGGKMYVSPNAAEMKRALDEKSSPSLMHLTDRLLLLADKAHRLKTTDLHNYDKIDEFVYDFCKRISAPEKKTKTLKRYADDDAMRVKVLNIKGQKVTVCTCDPEYVKLEGTIDFSPLNNLTYDYTPQNFIAQMHVGDEMTAYYHESQSGNSFDIVTAFEDLQLDDLEQVSEDTEFFATAADIFDDKTKVRWFTEEGYVIFTPNPHSVSEGDCAYITYSYYEGGNYRCWGDIQEVSDDKYISDINAVKAARLREFITTPAPKPEEPEVPAVKLSREQLHLLAALLINCERNKTNVHSKYILLCMVTVLLKMVGDTENFEYVELMTQYLSGITAFAQNNELGIRSIPISDDMPEMMYVRACTLDIIRSCYKPNQKMLDEFIAQTNNSTLHDICRLVQAYITMTEMNRTDRVRKAMHKEIVRAIAANSELQTDIDDDAFKPFGEENVEKEFKTSIVFKAGETNVPDVIGQMLKIMEPVCAFMNSDKGGTIYFGVNDSGFVRGLENDMTYLGISSMDEYKRKIQDAIHKYFPAEYLCAQNFTMHEKNQVLSLDVRPFEYGVAKLNNVAFRRWENENRQMNADQEADLLKKRSAKKQSVKNVSLLLQAINNKKQVKLCNYHSPQGQQLQERLVEPFAFSEGYAGVFALEIRKDNELIIKYFKLARIDEVQLADTPWQYETKHVQPKMDLFGMVQNAGAAGEEVVLQLKPLAKELLLEEFPAAKESIRKDADGASWTFTTTVYAPHGIGRFCMGLLGHITILKGDSLREHIRSVMSSATV